jgi:DNA invertase Pin-like site-specific DNA recombinase
MWDRQKKGRTAGVGVPKLHAKDVGDISQLRRDGVSVAQIAARYGVTRAAIYQIIDGDTWRWTHAQQGTVKAC